MLHHTQSIPFAGVAMAALAFCLSACTAMGKAPEKGPTLSVMAWNIWHGGREDGETLGPQKVIEVIRASGADLVAMQETYGSGELIREALGFHFQPRGTNVSIHSRYPILADVSVFEEFKCCAAVVAVPDFGPVVFVALWLPYGDDIWLPGARAGLSAEALRDAGLPSTRDLKTLLPALESRLQEEGWGTAPVLIAGDFNSMSHLDYTEDAVAQYGHVVPWTSSVLMESHGYRDGYRRAHPVVDRVADRTWSPRFPEQEADRIDFVYDRRNPWRVLGAERIDSHPQGFPSDHAAVVVHYGR